MEPATRMPLARLPVFLLLVLPILVLHYFVIPGLYDPGLHSKYLFLAGFLVLLAGIMFFRRPAAIPALHRSPVWWAALALPVILSVSLLWARTPMEGLATVARWWEVFLLISLLSITFTGSEHFHRLLPRVASVFLLITSIAALGQLVWVVRGQGYHHGSTYWVLVSFAHRNLLVHALALSMPLALLSFLRDRGAWWPVSGLALALGVAVLLLLLVRAGWLAVAVAGLVLMVLWWPLRARLDPLLRRRVTRRTFLLAGVGLAALLGGWWVFRPALQERDLLRKHSAAIGGISHGSPAERSLFWKRTMELWKMKPLTGHGAGSWKIEAPGRETGLSRESIGKGEVYVVRAHNDPLQLLAEAGPLGLLGFLILPLVAGRQGLRQVLRRDPEAGAQPLNALCYLMGLAVYLVIAAFSFPMERPSSYVWWAIYPAAILLNGPLPLWKPKRRTTVRMVALATLLPALGLLALGWVWIRQDGRWIAALDAGAAGDHRRMTEQINEELMFWMPLAPATTPPAWYRGMAHLEMRDTTAAIADFQRAFEVHPRHPHVLNNLATLLNSRGETETAFQLLRTAVEVAPGLEDARLNLAALEFNRGRVDSAYFHLRQIPTTSTNPKFAPFRTAIVGAVLDRVIAEHEGEKVVPIIRDMRNQAHWIENLHYKAVINELGMEQQALLDAVFVLYDDKKNVTFEEAETLYRQYQLNNR